jgi:capsular exopolysaccharide synthesis family protein
MQNPLNRYLMLAKRWAWVIVLGLVFCGGTTYLISKSTKPAYQATVIFVINVDTTSSNTSNAPSSIVAVPTYAQLLTNPLVLNPVVAKHRGMTLKQLNEMITIKPQTNTQLIEFGVKSSDPRLATQIANEVGQSYLLYTRSQLPGTLQMLPAQVPTEPISPKTSQDTLVGALIGLGLAVTLILIFEWVGDRLSSPENAQELLEQEILAVIPRFPNRHKSRGRRSEALMEQYRMLAASLNIAQAIKPFKVLMVTSALPGEGKSTVAANIASFLAATGRRILLIDANLHYPVLDQRFRLDNSQGISTILVETRSAPLFEFDSQETNIPTLRVLTSGAILTGSAELLQSPRSHQLFNHLQEAPFDYVVVDSPPLLTVADAQILIPLVQAVLLVVDADKTPRRVLLRAKRILSRTRAKILGVALNKSPWSDQRVSQQYLNGRRQRQESRNILIPPAAYPSQRVIPMSPPTPEPDSWGKPLHALSGVGISSDE